MARRRPKPEKRKKCLRHSGCLLFAYFLLDKQEKVGRPRFGNRNYKFIKTDEIARRAIHFFTTAGLLQIKLQPRTDDFNNIPIAQFHSGFRDRSSVQLRLFTFIRRTQNIAVVRTRDNAGGAAGLSEIRDGFGQLNALSAVDDDQRGSRDRGDTWDVARAELLHCNRTDGH